MKTRSPVAYSAAASPLARWLIAVVMHPYRRNGYWDAAQGCFIELRGWVSGIKASNAASVGVKVGTTRSVCVRNNVLSSAQVNEAEATLQYTRNELSKALKGKEALEPYLKDPAYKAQVTAQIQPVDQWIKYYEQIIAKTESEVATSAPQR